DRPGANPYTTDHSALATLFRTTRNRLEARQRGETSWTMSGWGQIRQTDLRQDGGRVIVVLGHPTDDPFYGRFDPCLFARGVGSLRAPFIELSRGLIIANVRSESAKSVQDIPVDSVLGGRQTPTTRVALYHAQTDVAHRR